jgi:putative phosphoribosyl transferase
VVDGHVLYDRATAGQRLGVEVAKIEFERPVVLGLPRGGVPVAAKIAQALGAPLDVIVVRKLGVPHRPELAMGAVGEDGTIVLNLDVVRAAHVTEAVLRGVEARERAELDKRLQRLRAVRPRESLADRTAIIVDDGIATGATVRAAIQVVRAHGARRVIVAVPIAPREAVSSLEADADRVVCLDQPDPFFAVGSWYVHFEAVSDEEVIALISAAINTGSATASSRKATNGPSLGTNGRGPTSGIGRD